MPAAATRQHGGGFADVLGEMYTAFPRGDSSGKSLGVVLMPGHIADFLCEAVGVTSGSVVYDSCAGTGGFLLAAMRQTSADGNGTASVVGAELSSELFPLLLANMHICGRR